MSTRSSSSVRRTLVDVQAVPRTVEVINGAAVTPSIAAVVLAGFGGAVAIVVLTPTPARRRLVGIAIAVAVASAALCAAVHTPSAPF